MLCDVQRVNETRALQQAQAAKLRAQLARPQGKPQGRAPPSKPGHAVAVSGEQALDTCTVATSFLFRQQFHLCDAAEALVAHGMRLILLGISW